jgi:ParB-like chromosome segregation protein Spo0J
MPATSPRLPDTIEHWPVDRLRPYGRNPRTHDDDQIAQIAASIIEFGWTNPVLVSADGDVIAGHGRLEAARRLSLDTVPVVVLDHLTPAQRRAYVIADNQLGLNAGWDEAKLSSELQALLADEFDLSLLGFGDGEIDKLLAADPDGEEGGDGGGASTEAIPEPPINPASRPGDLWILGEHRLLCGDATRHEDVRRLMNGERAALFATDPPYLVDYDGNEWDDSSQGAELYDGFIAAAIAEAITKDAAWYCWHASRRQAMLEACWEKAGAFVHQQIIWGQGPRRADPVALPLETRALLHGLAASEPSAEGRRPNAVLDLGNGELHQGRAPGPSDAEAARRLRHSDAPACSPRRALLRALLRLRLADHGGRGQWAASVRDGNQPGLCRCRRGAVADRDREVCGPRR